MIRLINHFTFGKVTLTVGVLFLGKKMLRRGHATGC